MNEESRPARRRSIVTRAGAAALAAALALPLAAAAQQGPPPCSGPEHRQFDFWLGDWDVTRVSNGQLAGHNEITSILGGCVLYESYDTPSGYEGSSFNAYDRQTGQWHQTWVDSGGLVLQLDGGLVDGRMVLSGVGKDAQGNDVLQRITWTPHDDGTVQQTWEQSTDGGATWTIAFDGIYKKRS